MIKRNDETSSRFSTSRALFTFIIKAALILGIVSRVHADPRTAIKACQEAFPENYAVTHGADSGGNGRMASALVKRPSDLTQLAVRNGDKFSQTRVREIISGRVALISHGSLEMPIWGERFGCNVNQEIAKTRIQNLPLYLLSIQVK